MRILVIDIGGTNVKVLLSGAAEAIKIPSGPGLTPAHMVSAVRKAIGSAPYEAVSIGYPGLVVHDRIVAEPKNLGSGWVGFSFAKAFKRPVKVVNDAAMQALGSYSGGRMLFLGLGTGLGSAMIADGVLTAMELAHLPYRKGRTFEDYLGLRGLERMGRKKWMRHVFLVVEKLQKALEPDVVVLGGGNAKKLDALPPGTQLGQNANAFLGGFRLWEPDTSPDALPVTPPSGTATPPRQGRLAAVRSAARRGRRLKDPVQD